MLEEFLGDVGIYRPGRPIADPELLAAAKQSPSFDGRRRRRGQ
jgi:hypothetical protein